MTNETQNPDNNEQNTPATEQPQQEQQPDVNVEHADKVTLQEENAAPEKSN